MCTSDFNDSAQLYITAGIYCLHGKLTAIWNFTPPEVMWTLIMKLAHTEVKFYPEVKSQTGLSSLRLSCKRALMALQFLIFLVSSFFLEISIYFISTEKWSKKGKSLMELKYLTSLLENRFVWRQSFQKKFDRWNLVRKCV